MADRFVIDTAAMRDVNVLRALDYHGGDSSLTMEVYRPVGVGPWPVVVILGGEAESPAAAEGRCRLVASVGMVGVTFVPRSWDKLRHVARKITDVEAAFRYVKARGPSWGADPGRMAVWGASSGVPLAVTIGAREGAACIVAYYGPMDLRAWGDDPRLVDVSPMALVDDGVDSDESVDLPPLLVVRCGQDAAELNESIDAFTNAAWDRDLRVDLLAYEEGHHGFEVVDDAAESRDVLSQTVEFLQEHFGVG